VILVTSLPNYAIYQLRMVTTQWKQKVLAKCRWKNEDFRGNASTFEQRCWVLGKKVVLGKIHFPVQK